MKAEELQGKTEDELQKMLLDLKKQQFNLRFQLSQGQLENTSQIRTTRRDIARVKTFLARQKAGVTAPAAAKKAPAKKAPAKKTATKAVAKKTTKADTAKKADSGDAAA